MLPLAGAIADTELKSGRGESVCRNRNGAAFSHLGSSIGAVEVDCTYFQSFSSRVRWRKTYCALSLSKLCWTGPFPAFFPDRKQVLQSRFWGSCKDSAFRLMFLDGGFTEWEFEGWDFEGFDSQGVVFWLSLPSRGVLCGIFLEGKHEQAGSLVTCLTMPTPYLLHLNKVPTWGVQIKSARLFIAWISAAGTFDADIAQHRKQRGKGKA